ncbi:hypothetical protein [Sabulicella glaciei]|uniref:Uncharacterized protein n=1 Tax=Sabulicella glaciei TaxID=2984948 RepID=A0ABT3NRJ0_9PROT|nr:hypothetical protein [Roseococcus sp. MDT2-1-1]MCW8084778.1 hypothetical protein [Roseococcus sp. MDT2-1-1]
MSEGRARSELERLVAEPRPCTMDKARDALLALSALRDELARRRRAGEPVEEDLRRVNSALALTWSGALPVAGFRPGRLEKARAILEGG